MVIGTVSDPPTHVGTARIARPRIFILSDCRVLCEGLVLALAEQPSIIVVGASDAPVSPAEIGEFHPDALLLDVAMVGGLSIAVAARQLLPDMRIVAIAVAEIEDEVIACARAGVAGFVSRKGSVQDVVTAVQCALRGEFICSPRVAALLFSHVGVMSGTRNEALSTNGKLTRREHEIVSLISEGLSNKEIARTLRIQNATVKNHIHNILGKMQVRRRAEVASRLRRAEPISSGAAISATLGPLQIR